MLYNTMKGETQSMQEKSQLYKIIEKARIDAGMTKKELAQRMKTSPQNLHGKLKTSKFTYEELDKIANILSCKLVLEFEPIPEYQITAYDKDAGIYDVLQTGSYKDLYPQLHDLQEQCKQEKLIRKENNQPYDWVFLELKNNTNPRKIILPDNI